MPKRATTTDRSTPTPDQLRARVRETLEPAEDPARAPQMQAYMKSALPYLGVPLPRMRSLLKGLYDRLAIDDARQWRALVLGLWNRAAYREERYAAIQLVRHRVSRPFVDPEALDLLEHLVVTGAWWDLVDELATHVFADLLASHRAPMSKAMRRWAKSDDVWKRRVAILCQLKAADEMDRSLLEDCLAPSLREKEFFLRKAIGWALREYAYTDPDYVRRYVALHRAVLSPLSIREATKHLE